MKSSQIRNIILVALALMLLAGSRTIAELVIEYQWWAELGQVTTWYSMLLYEVLPAAIASLVAWLTLLWAHGTGVKFAAVPESNTSLYRRLVMIGLLVLAVIFIGSAIDSLKVMAFVGSLSATPSAWTDPVFGQDLGFYMFRLPFYTQLLRFVFVLAVFTILVFWASGRGWQLFERLRQFRAGGGNVEEFDPGPNPLLLTGATQTNFAKILAAVGLIAMAAWFYLGRYGLLMSQHSSLTGMDWVDENVTLPLRWVVIVAALVCIPLVALAKLRIAVIMLAGALVANTVLPEIILRVVVKPNELEKERPYIARHIEATTQAYGLATRATEEPFAAAQTDAIDVEAHGTLVDNIRLWDWRAFNDTITQIQALRPYYRFADVDIDRYTIDGKIKQVLLSPREIDVAQLPGEARDSWISRNLIYTHGYGVVVSEVNRTTDDGLPVLLIQDAPPVVKTADLDLTRPEIYYGEFTQSPVFVSTDEKEFDYPSGDENIYAKYGGTGGFPIDSILLRLAASIATGEYNIVLTGQMNETSRMMIYRGVQERLEHLAPFIHWEQDPYLVITDEGRLVWIVDGYTTSDAHPYSAHVNVGAFGGRVNYVRNAVKATVDAYTGETKVYQFEVNDPVVQVYRALFPELFEDQADMPASLREHARYPELMFSVQAEIYRTFHMRDPEVFYSKEDVWEVAQSLAGDKSTLAPMSPTYIVATLPGEQEPEFLLMLPFTPRGRPNLIGWMAARCDGEKLGELRFFQLSKQELVFGPSQIEARINQDQEIAKDLTLWGQQGSRVLRGDMIALPVDDNFLYVESIYIQAESARMPQLRKVVLAMGNRLIYEDTFEDALARLGGGTSLAMRNEAAQGDQPPGETPAQSATKPSDGRLRSLAARVQQLRRQAENLVKDLSEVEQDLQR
ncbi:MAG: UPF0182 family protein [Acidobacteria bacterium]|nr:UPF0182 family protein [Acidobacteriota bacterium]